VNECRKVQEYGTYGISKARQYEYDNYYLYLAPYLVQLVVTVVTTKWALDWRKVLRSKSPMVTFVRSGHIYEILEPIGPSGTARNENSPHGVKFLNIFRLEFGRNSSRHAVERNFSLILMELEKIVAVL